MRFDKRSRKIRVKKKNRKKESSRSTAAFWGYMVVALILLGGFYFLLYGAHKKGLRRVRQEKIQEDFDRICAAAILYAQDHGAFPSSEEGVAVLVKKAEEPAAPGEPSRDSGTLESFPLDPWQKPYTYRGSGGADEVTLICWGSDGRPGGAGEAADVIRKGCRSTALPPH